MRKFYPLLTAIIILSSFCSPQVNAQLSSLNEGFKVGVPATWTILNHSDSPAPGVPAWFQGYDSANFVFDAHSGATDSYVASDYELTLDTLGNATLSGWLISPVLNLTNGAVIKFWTRRYVEDAAIGEYPDRLEVRLSTKGTSTNIGSTSTAVGDFTTLLVSVNPNLATDVYPTTWTEFTATLSGIASGTTGRIAFRYYVTNGGPGGDNSDYIGLDDFSYASTLPVSYVNFDGFAKDGKVLLNWSTSNELNNKGYDVERSVNGKDFSAIGFVKGNGSTTNVNNYTYSDNGKLPSGTLYYRLRQIDLDGASNYSNIIKLDITTQLSLNVYPNPVLNNAWVQFQLASNAKVTMQLVSSTGKILQAVDKGLLSAGTYSVPLNLNNASKGTYFIKLFVGDKTYSQTIIK